jgi:hypothetical protein
MLRPYKGMMTSAIAHAFYRHPRSLSNIADMQKPLHFFVEWYSARLAEVEHIGSDCARCLRAGRSWAGKQLPFLGNYVRGIVAYQLD